MSTPPPLPAQCPACQGARIVLSTNADYLTAQLCPECTGHRCERCSGGRVLFRQDEHGASFSRPCPCQSKARFVEAYNAAHLPKIYAKSTFKDFLRTSDSVGAAKDATQALFNAWETGKTERGIGLVGSCGTGKTHLIVALARALTLRKGVAVRFVEFSHMLAEIKAGFDQKRSMDSVLGPLTEAPLLIIDEMGKALSTEWQLSVLDELISKRYNRGLPIAFTSNFPISNPVAGGFRAVLLRERVDERIFSRLMAMCDIYEVAGPDQRHLALRG